MNLIKDKPTLIKWPKIKSFFNIHKNVKNWPAIINNNSKVIYKGKVKLHGTRSSIQFYKNTPYAQNRSQVLGSVLNIDKGNDNAGFRKWLNSHKDVFTEIIQNSNYFSNNNFSIFGEWVGPGIQKKCSIHKIKKPIFAIFAIQDLDNILISNPNKINYSLKDLISQIPEMYVLPWETEELIIDWLGTKENLEQVVDQINLKTKQIEDCDPWVAKTFGIEGTGEGLVYYPITSEHSSFKDFENLGFKAKGEKHKVLKTKNAAQLDPEVVASINEFVDLVCTKARLEQALNESCKGVLVIKNLGPFIGYLCKDIKEECQEELKASNLSWKPTSKAIADYARGWYLNKINSLE